MFDFFRTWFKPERSSATAKERLRLVLLSDHLSLAPEVVEALKADLLAVIQRYVEIDADHADVTFEHREHEVAMLASIPIRALRDDRPAPPPPAPPPAPPEPAVLAAVETQVEPETVELAQPPAHRPATAANGAPRRRRRRKSNPAAQNVPPPQTSLPQPG
jgi:cell division topological specificity factor